MFWWRNKSCTDTQVQNCTDNQKSLIIDQMKVKIQEEADIRSLVPIDKVPIDMIS